MTEHAGEIDGDDIVLVDRAWLALVKQALERGHLVAPADVARLILTVERLDDRRVMIARTVAAFEKAIAPPSRSRLELLR